MSETVAQIVAQLGGEVEVTAVFKDRRVAPAEVEQRRREELRLAAVATQLHLGFSMRRSEILVNTRARFPAPP